jgi:hypothetical protein
MSVAELKSERRGGPQVNTNNLWLLTCTALLFAAVPPAYAQNSSVQGGLHTFSFNAVKSLGLRPSLSRALNLEAVLVENDTPLENPVRYTNTSRNYIGLQVRRGLAAEISSSLKISFISGRTPKVEECAARISECAKVNVKSKADQHVFSISGGEFKIFASPSPCIQNHTECSLFIPSWALNWMVANGSLPSLPKVLMIAQTANRIAFFDAGTSHKFIVLPRSDNIKSLGAISGAEFNEDKTLSISFAKGKMLLDFHNDQIIVADGSGIHAGHRGISGGLNPEFKTIYLRQNSSADTPLFLNSKIARWAGELAEINRKTDGSADRAQGRISDLPSLANSTIAREMLIERSQTSYTGPDNANSSSLLLKSESNSMKILNGGHVFLPVHSSGGCSLVHQVQEAQVPDKFMRTGFSLPCTFAGKIKASSRGIYAFDPRSDIPTTHVWLFKETP